MDRTDFTDDAVIYWSTEDDAFVAHSLRTDQIGMGDRMVDALAAMIEAVSAAIEAHEADATVELFSEAPDEVKALAEGAENLPGEIYDIAVKMATGRWPADLKVDLAEDTKLEDFARRRFRLDAGAMASRESSVPGSV